MDSLKRQLFLTHSKPALLSAMGLTVAIIVVAILYFFSASLIDTVLPNAIRTNKLKVSINKSESLLRHWVLIKDSSTRLKRRRIWQEDIEPTMSLLMNNFQDKNQGYNVEIIETAQHLQAKLIELRDIQWWIEDITYYNDNNLAKYFLDKNISSVFDNLDKLLGSLHPNQQQNNKVKEKILITQKHLLKSFHVLTNTITYRETTSKEQFFYIINIADRLINDLSDEDYADIESQRILEWLRKEFDHYYQQSLKAINLRYSQYWDGSLQQLETNKSLLEFEVNNLISTLSHYENAKLEKKTSDLSNYLVVLVPT